MDQRSVNLYITTHAKYFPPEQIFALQQSLLKCAPATFTKVKRVQLKDPESMFLISLFLGGFGVDRFMLGNIGTAIAKLLTFGACGVLHFVDLFSIKQETQTVNFNTVAEILKSAPPAPIMIRSPYMPQPYQQIPSGGAYYPTAPVQGVPHMQASYPYSMPVPPQACAAPRYRWSPPSQYTEMPPNAEYEQQQ